MVHCTLGPVLHARPRLASGYFCLENDDDPRNRCALRWDNLPASLDLLPQTIREFGVIGSSRPTSFQHGENRRNGALVGEWNLTGEDLMVNHYVQQFIRGTPLTLNSPPKIRRQTRTCRLLS